MPLINCKVDLSLTWSENGGLSNVAGASTFKIADAKLYVPVVTLSKKTMINYQNYWVKDLKDQCIGTNTK